jgi:hypothetical protein
MHKNDRTIVFLGLIIVIIALVGAGISGAPKIVEGDDKDPSDDYKNWPTKRSSVYHVIGEELAEGSSTTITITNINDTYITRVFFELHWEDEDNIKDAGGLKVENKPDYFNFSVMTPWGQFNLSENLGSEYGGAGQILMDITVPEMGAAADEWLVTITCVDCGDQVVVGPITGTELYTYEADDSNGWELSYYYEFHTNN